MSVRHFREQESTDLAVCTLTIFSKITFFNNINAKCKTHLIITVKQETLFSFTNTIIDVLLLGSLCLVFFYFYCYVINKK